MLCVGAWVCYIPWTDTFCRSHSVFIVHVKQRADDDTLGQGLTAKINLVDLAGSERQNMAGTDGQTLREGAYINKRCFRIFIRKYSTIGI